MVRKVGNGVANLLLGAAGLAVLYCFLIVFCISSFKIPTNSMQPALQPGDYILVQKLSLGARLFNLVDALEGKEVAIHRLPGWGGVKRNDVVVFNFPLSKDWSRVEFDVMLYYAKRCIALPGDTLEVRKSLYRVRGVKEPLGDVPKQRAMQRIRLSDWDDGVAYWNPRESGWTLHEAGPFLIPAKGTVLAINRLNALLYGRLIEWEQRRKVEIKGDTVLLAGRVLRTYRFRENYYFMAGDNCEDSMDSRYWGLVPEDFMVGKAWLIWRSVDPYRKVFRWDRFLRRI